MNPIFYITFIIVSFTQPAFGQIEKDYLTQMRSNYSNLKNIAVELNYELYKGYLSDSAVEAYQSIYRKSDRNQYRRVEQTELITIGDISLNINHSDRTVNLSDAKLINYFDFDLQRALLFCKKIDARQIDGGYKVTLFLKEKTDIPISKIQIKVDKHFWVQQTILYYNHQINFSNSVFTTDLDFPKLVVNYKALDKKWKDKEGICELQNYIRFKNDTPILSEKFESYKLIDARRKKY